MNTWRVRQGAWLAVGTLVPFLLFFALPILGLSEGLSLTVAKAALLAFHVWIMVLHRPAVGHTTQTPVPHHVREIAMPTLSPLRLGFALGCGLSLAYLSCVVLISVLPREAAVRFFNSLFHCVDVQPLLRWETSFLETLFGVISVLILGWLFAAVVAVLYNLAATWVPTHEKEN